MFIFYYRRKKDQKSPESFSSLEERSMESSSTADEVTSSSSLRQPGRQGNSVYLDLFLFVCLVSLNFIFKHVDYGDLNVCDYIEWEESY